MNDPWSTSLKGGADQILQRYRLWKGVPTELLVGGKMECRFHVLAKCRQRSRPEAHVPVPSSGRSWAPLFLCPAPLRLKLAV